MKNLALATLSVLAITFTSCKNDSKNAEKEITEELEITEAAPIEDAISEVIAITLESKSGSNATGKVGFTQKGNMVTFEATLSGLTLGTHAIHIHETADCSSTDGKSAGGHWNPTMQEHGKWGAQNGYHKGDIGNFNVDADGTGSISMQTDQWCIGCGDKTKDILGKAIIVHKGTDDFKSQPSGAAGARVSCGGIIE